jgi:hypothetical protein
VQENRNARRIKKGYMNDNNKNEYFVETQDKFDGKLESKDAAKNSISNSLSRRSFLGRATTSTAVAAAGVGFPALLLTENAEARGAVRFTDEGDDEGD